MTIKDLVFTSKNLHFNKGDTIFKERDDGEEMYFIDSGEIQVVKTLANVDVNIAHLSSGDFFGEMALITGNKHSASAIAFTDCSLHVMDRKHLSQTLQTTATLMTEFFYRLLSALQKKI